MAIDRKCQNIRCNTRDSNTFYIVMIGGVFNENTKRHIQVHLCEECARGVWRPDEEPFERNAAPVVEVRS